MNNKICIEIKPRIMTSGIIDFCITSLLVFPIQLLALFVLPLLVTYMLIGSWSIALIVPIIIYIVFQAFSVSKLTLTDEGIRFHRIMGTPKLLPWTKISSIEVTPRKELICKGWLWPLLPAREMTASLSSQGHYRITWQGGFCYYPPNEPKVFEQYVDQHLPK